MTDDAVLRRRRTTFDGVAERYDAMRPGYPRAVLDDLLRLAGVGPGDRVLEIGCGTGQLSVDLARRGLDLTAIELGPALATVARRNLTAFPQARVVVGAFEDLPVREPVDAVVAALSFHWVPPGVRVTRASAALRPGGALAVVEVQHVAGGTEAFFAAAQDCYLRFDPATEPGFRTPTADEVPPAYPELDDAASFGSVQRRRRHPAALLGHERRPLDDPRVDQVLAGLAFELVEHRVDGHGHTRDEGLCVRVDQGPQLVAVGAAEGSDHGGHTPPADETRSRHRCGTASGQRRPRLLAGIASSSQRPRHLRGRRELCEDGRRTTSGRAESHDQLGQVALGDGAPEALVDEAGKAVEQPLAAFGG